VGQHGAGHFWVALVREHSEDQRKLLLGDLSESVRAEVLPFLVGQVPRGEGQDVLLFGGQMLSPDAYTRLTTRRGWSRSRWERP
jgi:hypothetical protein